MSSSSRRDVLAFLLASPALSSAARAAEPGAWPAKPVRIVVPYGAGGAADTVCRTIFARIAEMVGQPFIIDNRTGGNTIVGASAVLQAPPDGSTFLVNSSQMVVNPILMSDLPFDLRTSFIPVTKMSSYPQVLAVKKDLPAQTLQEFIAYAKTVPGKVSYGTPPAAGMGHMAGELLQRNAGIRLEHVPYRIATEAARDVAGGNLQSVFLTVSTIQPMLQTGRVRVLAVTSAQRTPSLPEIPTFAEQGLPGFDMDDWNGLFAAKGTSTQIVKQMQALIAEASKDPTVLARMTALGTKLVGSTPDEFTVFLDQQRDLLGKLIKDANIKLE